MHLSLETFLSVYSASGAQSQFAPTARTVFTLPLYEHAANLTAFDGFRIDVWARLFCFVMSAQVTTAHASDSSPVPARLDV